jgi:hypothetical protein
MPTDTVLVDTCDKLHACLEDVERIPAPASVVVDLEGINICRHGRIAIMQLHAQGSNTVWLIDVTTLGARAFDEACSRGKTLRGLLEGPHIRKVSRLLAREQALKFTSNKHRYFGISETTQMPYSAITTLASETHMTFRSWNLSCGVHRVKMSNTYAV